MSRTITIRLTEHEAAMVTLALSAAYECCDEAESLSTFGDKRGVAAAKRAIDKIRAARCAKRATP